MRVFTDRKRPTSLSNQERIFGWTTWTRLVPCANNGLERVRASLCSTPMDPSHDCWKAVAHHALCASLFGGAVLCLCSAHTRYTEQTNRANVTSHVTSKRNALEFVEGLRCSDRAQLTFPSFPPPHGIPTSKWLGRTSTVQ